MFKWLKRGVKPSADGQDAARAKDWLAALSPLFLMMLVNYRWSAVWAVITATAGYLAVTVGWDRLGLMPRRVAPALLCGVLVTACLPADAPIWLGGAAGLFAATVAVLPPLYNRVSKQRFLSVPVYLPAMAGYLLTRWAFSARFTAYALPLMWERVDAVTSATPLAALGQPEAAAQMPHLFWGFEAGSMGQGPAVAVFFGFVFLLLRRRVQLLSPAAMAASVFLLSWMCWGMPLYSMLAGGTLLALALAGDEGMVHVGWKGRLAYGATAGVVTVLCRLWWGVDGAAVGLLLAGVLIPVLHVIYHLLCHYVPPIAAVVWGFLRRTVPPMARAVYRILCRFAAFLREKFAKSEN